MNSISTATWTDDRWTTAKVWLKEQLVSNRATITFEKTDGTLRTMRCSLMGADLPPLVESTDKPKRVRAENPDTLAVFDLDKGEWRSFRIRSIKTIEV